MLQTIGGLGGYPFSFSCPAGHTIVGFEGGAGSAIDRIQAVCSDGTKSAVYGGKGGVPFSESSVDGYTGVSGLQDKVVMNLAFVDKAGNMSSKHGGTVGTPVLVNCPAGTQINSMNGRSGSLLDNVTFGCQDVSVQHPVSGAVVQWSTTMIFFLIFILIIFLAIIGVSIYYLLG